MSACSISSGFWSCQDGAFEHPDRSRQGGATGKRPCPRDCTDVRWGRSAGRRASDALGAMLGAVLGEEAPGRELSAVERLRSSGRHGPIRSSRGTIQRLLGSGPSASSDFRPLRSAPSPSSGHQPAAFLVIFLASKARPRSPVGGCAVALFASASARRDWLGAFGSERPLSGASDGACFSCRRRGRDVVQRQRALGQRPAGGGVRASAGEPNRQTTTASDDRQASSRRGDARARSPPRTDARALP